jgi:hypothetical protein
MSPGVVPDLAPQPVAPPPAPGIDINLPPAPTPKPDSTTRTTIRDPSFHLAAARMKYIEQDTGSSGVQQASLETPSGAASNSQKTRKPKQKTTTVDQDPATSRQ